MTTSTKKSPATKKVASTKKSSATPRRSLSLVEPQRRVAREAKPAAPVSDVPDPAQIAQMAQGQKISLEAEAKIPDAPKADDPEVTVIVPKGYKLTLDDGKRIDYPAGVQEMPKSHVEHWYSRAHGVTIYQPKK